MAWSVTKTPCSCGTLEREAEDPDSPVTFDRESRCYSFVCQLALPEGPSPFSLLIYHCPFCGGVAPKAGYSGACHVIPRREVSSTRDSRSGPTSIFSSSRLASFDFCLGASRERIRSSLAELEDSHSTGFVIHVRWSGVGVSPGMGSSCSMHRVVWLALCHCYREDDEVIRIISARRADRRERGQYEVRSGR